MSQILASLNVKAPVATATRQSTKMASAKPFLAGQRLQGKNLPMAMNLNKVQKASGRGLAVQVSAVKDGTVLDRPLRVAVIGGGPSGACAAETLAKGGVETFLIERKMVRF